MAGMKDRIPYKGNAPPMNNLLSARLQLMFANCAAVIPHIRSGPLKAPEATSVRASEAYIRAA